MTTGLKIKFNKKPDYIVLNILNEGKLFGEFEAI
jgi:hypothetical protein